MSISQPSIGFGPLNGPDRVLAGGGTGTPTDPSAPPTVVDPGTGQPTPSPKPTDLTLTIPSLTLTTTTYDDGVNQELKSEVKAVWGMPSAGESQTDPYKIGRYEISFTQGAAFSPEASSRTRSATIRSLKPEVETTVRVRAVTNGGQVGPWRGETIDTKRDDEPPPVPSKPSMLATLRGAAVRWDGKYAGGEPPPSDWRYTIAEVSLDPQFAPDATIPAGFLYEAGMTATTLVGQSPFTVYARLIGVDFSGNRSIPSEVASAKSLQAVREDIGDEAITKDQLAKAAVQADKIAEAAVTAFGIKPGAVTSDGLSDLAVTTKKIVDGAIDAIKLQADAVQPRHLVDGAVIQGKLGALAVTASAIAENAVVLGKIGANAVDNLALISGSATTDKIAREAVTADLIGKLAVKAQHAGFSVAGANQLENSSFDNVDAPLEYWVADGNVHIASRPGSLIHGKMALVTTFDETAPRAPALTAT